MSQCEGVNIYASGDYLIDERQGYLCSTIERLRAHMVTLKEKLQEEKTLLSELKAETQYLTMQQTDNMYEDYYPDSYQSKHCVSESSLGPPNIANAGEIAMVNRTVEEPTKNSDRVDYIHRLEEIDNLCKEEMSRMNTVVEQMEPLKQMASDWMLETRLKEMSEVPEPRVGRPVLEVSAAAPYRTEQEIDPAIYRHPSYSGDVIVVPPERPTPPISDPPVRMETTIIKSSKSKSELKSKKEPQLKLDCLMKPVPQKNVVMASDKKAVLAKRKRETKLEESSSDVSLSSLEALKEKNITLIEGADYADKNVANKLDKKAEEDWNSTGSGKASKNAISLESIQRAFANHHNMRRKAVKGETRDTNALGSIKMAPERRKNMSSEKNNGEYQTKRDKLFAYLHPSAKKIVKNWVIAGKEEKKLKRLADRKPERSKKCTLNIGRHKEAELSLCEDDVINKFLYDEEGYVYTPLFVSETEEESSSETNSVNEN